MLPAYLETQPPTLSDRVATPAPIPVPLYAPRDYQSLAQSVFEDAELLLRAILPEARIEHVGASSIPGAYSKADVDVCVEMPGDRLMDALGVLAEAGFRRRPYALRTDRLCRLTAQEGAFALPLTLQLVESDREPCFLVRLRDALREDATLLVRYNALRLEAAPLGAQAYRRVKASFIGAVLGE